MSSIYLARAKFAYDEIIAYKKHNNSAECQSKLKSYARNVPMYIKTNGLLAAMEFVKVRAGKSNQSSTDKKAYQCIYDMVTKWAAQSVLEDQLGKEDDFIEKLIHLPMAEYKNTEREILNFFNWVYRFAEGELKGEEKLESEEESNGEEELESEEESNGEEELESGEESNGERESENKEESENQEE